MGGNSSSERMKLKGLSVMEDLKCLEILQRVKNLEKFGTKQKERIGIEYQKICIVRFKINTLLNFLFSRLNYEYESLCY